MDQIFEVNRYQKKTKPKKIGGSKMRGSPQTEFSEVWTF